MIPGINGGCGCGGPTVQAVGTPYVAPSFTGTLIAADAPASAQGFHIAWWLWVLLFILVFRW